MRMNWMLSAAVVAMCVTAAAGAQSSKAMAKPSKGDTMSMTYTGCVESVNHGAVFLLTKVEGAASMHDDMAMKHHDDMPMKSDAAKTMQHEDTLTADENMDAMPSKSFALAGSTNLTKHVGQKVSVTGSLSDSSGETMRQDLSTLTIRTMKVIAKSCS